LYVIGGGDLNFPARGIKNGRKEEKNFQERGEGGTMKGEEKDGQLKKRSPNLAPRKKKKKRRQ